MCSARMRSWFLRIVCRRCISYSDRFVTFCILPAVLLLRAALCKCWPSWESEVVLEDATKGPSSH
jgi:hypothetical protein